MNLTSWTNGANSLLGQVGLSSARAAARWHWWRVVSFEFLAFPRLKSWVRHSGPNPGLQSRGRDLKTLGLWVVLLLLALPMTAACARNPNPYAVPLRPASDVPTVTRFASASVLISSVPQDAVPEVKTIRVFPASIVVDQGERVALSAEAFGDRGQPLRDVEFIWAMADPRAGRIDGQAVFRAGVAPGTFNGTVSVTGIQNTPQGTRYASAEVSVVVVGEARASKLDSVAILPSGPTVLSGQIYRMRAVGYDEDGLVMPGVNFTWRVNDQALGRVNDIGYLTVEGEKGEYNGAMTVTGVWEGMRVSATADVTVIQRRGADDFLNVQVLPQRFFLDSGGRLQLRAVALNGLGELITGTVLRWKMADPRAGTIDGSGNFVAGITAGIYTEAVRVEAIVPGERGIVRAADFASVVVRKKRYAHLENINLLPGSVTLEPSARALLLVQATDEFGDSADNVEVSWEVAWEGVGEIDDHGNFKATGRPGRYPKALRVNVEQRLGDEVVAMTESVDVTITGTLTDLEIHPAQVTIAAGRTIHFSLTGWDENGVRLSGMIVLWSVTDDRVGTIDPFGNFTAGKIAGMHKDLIQAEVIQTIPYQQ